jgi:hypothetical protein
MTDHHHDAIGSALLATHATTHAEAAQAIQWSQRAAQAAQTPGAWEAYQAAAACVVRRFGSTTTAA